jgi:quercetin dioxygenase-like cupin family protein
MKFLQTSKNTNGKLLEMESTYFSNSKELPQHFRPFQDEEFTVLQGDVSVRIDDSIKDIKQGEILNIPANKNYSMWNNSDNKTVANWKVKPALNKETFMETIIGLAEVGKTNKDGIPNLLQMSLIAKKFGIKLK